MSNNKIDIVVSWLDDTDASWQKEFQYYKNLENKETIDLLDAEKK